MVGGAVVQMPAQSHSGLPVADYHDVVLLNHSQACAPRTLRP